MLRSVRFLFLGSLALFLVASPIARAQTPEKPTRTLQVEPNPILLQGANRQQQLLVSAQDATGGWVDVTHRVTLTLANPLLADVVGTTLMARQEGETEAILRFEGTEVRVPVILRSVGQFPPIHFANDLVPLFSKYGCNSAGCHGKASGQNGFRLSVFGSDPEADYEALTREARGRRILPGNPGASLLVAKATGRMAHGGGRRLPPGSRDEETLIEWLRQGMPVGLPSAPRLVRLLAQPAERTLAPHSRQQILTTAIFSDGSRRDVTSAAGYASNATLIAGIERGGLIHAGSTPGEAAITVHYMGEVAAVRVTIPRQVGRRPYPTFPIHNRIDELVLARWKNVGLIPAELSEDTAFLRRVFLDVLGTLPTPEEVRHFLDSPVTDRRTRLIDRLLQRPEYADLQALRWADILLVDRDRLGDRGAFAFHQWLREQFAHNRPYDVWVRELVTASGSSARHGPVNFYRAAATPEEAARALSQAFLGLRLECAQCHHHPFEKWSQEDFHSLAGFFQGLKRRAIKGDGELLWHDGLGEMRLPLSGKVISVRPPGSEHPLAKSDEDPRRALAEWMTRSDNPWFSRLIANRLWKYYFGRGLVEPEDDLRSTNPATNEPLLTFLAKTVVDSGYDLKATTRLILTSRVYQLAHDPKPDSADDTQNFAHHPMRRLSAEVLVDALSQVTEIPEVFPGRPRGTRALELWDNRLPSYALDIFGRPERTSPCECGRSNEPNLTQVLHLLNAPEVERKVAHPQGRVARLLRSGVPNDRLVEELCLAALGRAPSAKEHQVARDLFARAPREQAAQDFLWALLNSYDFLFVP